jgi:hypothetical protein
MSDAGKAKLLGERLSHDIEQFKVSRIRNRRHATLSRVTVAVLTALTTIVLGLNFGMDNSNYTITAKNIALVLTATATVVSAWDTFIDPRSLWVRYTQTLVQLYAVKADFDYMQSGDPNKVSVDQIDELFRRYQGVLDQTNKDWMERRLDPNRSVVKPVVRSA